MAAGRLLFLSAGVFAIVVSYFVIHEVPPAGAALRWAGVFLIAVSFLFRES